MSVPFTDKDTASLHPLVDKLATTYGFEVTGVARHP